jgi:hypothetical protein
MVLTPARDPALGTIRQRIALALIVCLPVPVLAGSGLAIPLPSVVYRVAVAVAERTHEIAVGIPGVGALVDESSDAVRSGTIQLLPAELDALGGATIGTRERAARARSRTRVDPSVTLVEREDATSRPNGSKPAAAGEVVTTRPADGRDSSPAPTNSQPAPEQVPAPAGTQSAPPPPADGGETTPSDPLLPPISAPEVPETGLVPELPPVPLPISTDDVDVPIVPTVPTLP